MNYFKRIEIKKRPPHFQQGGGSNIHIGSPKPYTVGNLPGVNFNPLTLTNAPIEIDTTSFLDRINQMEKLKFNREELAYKYKALESKDAANQLNFIKGIIQTSYKTRQDGAAAGGITNLSPYFSAKEAEFKKMESDLIGDIVRGVSQKDFSSFFKLQDLYSNPEYLKFQTQKQIINDIADVKNDYGLRTPQIMNKLMSVIDHPNPTDDLITDLMMTAQTAKGVKVSAKDVNGVINAADNSFFKNFNQTETLEVFDQNTGTKVIKTVKTPPSLSQWESFLESYLTTDPIGQEFLYSQGFDPYNLSKPARLFIQNLAKARHAAHPSSFQENMSDIQGKLIPEIDGEDGSGGKKSEKEKTIDDIEKRLREEVGDEAAEIYRANPRAYPEKFDEIKEELGGGKSGGSASGATIEEIETMVKNNPKTGFTTSKNIDGEPVIKIHAEPGSKIISDITSKWPDAVVRKDVDDDDIREEFNYDDAYGSEKRGELNKDTNKKQYNDLPIFSNRATVIEIPLKTTPSKRTNSTPAPTGRAGGITPSDFKKGQDASGTNPPIEIKTTPQLDDIFSKRNI